MEETTNLISFAFPKDVHQLIRAKNKKMIAEHVSNFNLLQQ